MEDVEIAFIAFSTLAAFMSGLVLLTVCIFPDMQKRLFMNIIVWISASDLLASIASAWGFPNQGTYLCAAQAFAVPFFYKASWLWTTVLSYNIYKIAFYGVSEINMLAAHSFSWGLSLLSTLLPLATNDYGREADDASGESELAWCSLSGNNSSASIMILITFNVLLLVVFIANIYIQTKIYLDARFNKADSSSLFAVLNVIILYPPGFLLTWGPNLIFSIILNFGVSGNSEAIADIFDAVSILATQSGTVFAIIFFLKCREARARWKAAIQSLFCGVLGEPRDWTTAISTINRATDEDLKRHVSSEMYCSEFETEDADLRTTLEKQLAKFKAETRLTETTSTLYGDGLNFEGRDSAISARVSTSSQKNRLSLLQGTSSNHNSAHNALSIEDANSKGVGNSFRVDSVAESEASSEESGWNNFNI